MVHVQNNHCLHITFAFSYETAVANTLPTTSLVIYSDVHIYKKTQKPNGSKSLLIVINFRSMSEV